MIDTRVFLLIAKKTKLEKNQKGRAKSPLSVRTKLLLNYNLVDSWLS